MLNALIEIAWDKYSERFFIQFKWLIYQCKIAKHTCISIYLSISLFLNIYKYRYWYMCVQACALYTCANLNLSNVFVFFKLLATGTSVLKLSSLNMVSSTKYILLIIYSVIVILVTFAYSQILNILPWFEFAPTEQNSYLHIFNFCVIIGKKGLEHFNLLVQREYSNLLPTLLVWEYRP